MAIAPDLFPSNQKNPPADDDSVFTPIAPIEKPVFIPEPENPENPFVALSPALTNVELPAKKTKPLPPKTASLIPAGEPLPAIKPLSPARPQPKPAAFLFEDVSINIAPEFMPAKPAPPPNPKMNFSLDYKNPEAEQLLKSPREKQKDTSCHKCGKPGRNTTLFKSNRGPVCPHCYNPYFHKLLLTIFENEDSGFKMACIVVSILRFIAAWLFPIVPAILWYALFVRTGFGGFFEDSATILFAPTLAGLFFVFLLLLGLFFIPSCIASVSLGETVFGSFSQINLMRLFPLVQAGMPGYVATFCVLTASTAINLAGIAVCVEAGMAGASNVLAVLLAVGMSAVEMGMVRWLTIGRNGHSGVVQ